MRLGIVTVMASALVWALPTSDTWAQPEADGATRTSPRRVVVITESSAVVYALDCPEGAAPTWQPVRVYTNVALPELEWLGVGRTRICGVDVRGVETQVILACQRADGTHHGPVGSWYPSGEKRTEGHCDHGVAHGRWRRLARDGRLEVEGRFERGAAAGVWSVLGPDGRMKALPAAEVRSAPPVF